jgi:hypothetical protein
LPQSLAEFVTCEHIRANAEIKRGEIKSALHRYRRILRADPCDRIASLNMVWLATRLDLSSEIAATVGLWALCLFPENHRLKFLTGRTLFWRGRISAAIPLLGETIEEGPDPKRAYSLLGEAVSLRSNVSENPSLGGPVSAPVGHRLVAFVRDVVSMDHVLPVAWRWVAESTRDAVIIFMGPMPRIDWRIEFAGTIGNLHVRTLLDLAPDLDVDKMMIDLFSGASGRVVVFDQTNYAMARVFGGVARRHGAPFVALPHGEEALTNFLVKPRDTARPAKTENNADLYDLVIHSSDFTIKKHGLTTGPTVAVLGSARYCRDWVHQISLWVRPAEELPTGDNLRLVLFLPKPDFIVDWDELEAVLAILGQRAGSTLLVKAHPRRAGRHRLIQVNGEWDIEIVEFVGREMLTQIVERAPEAGWIAATVQMESSILVDWADVVLSLGTSVTWQAAAANKPVLELSWCHGNRTTMSKYLPSTDLRSRDDLLDALDRIEAEGTGTFYPPGEREEFIARFIEPPLTSEENTVLDAYVQTLEELARRGEGTIEGNGQVLPNLDNIVDKNTMARSVGDRI